MSPIRFLLFGAFLIVLAGGHFSTASDEKKPGIAGRVVTPALAQFQRRVSIGIVNKTPSRRVRLESTNCGDYHRVAIFILH